jgi:GNAT superfamily N-acetyltransferase
MHPQVSLFDSIQTDEVVSLYKATGWSSGGGQSFFCLLYANRTPLLLPGSTANSSVLPTPFLTATSSVYFPHMLVHPRHQRKGVGRALMQALLDRYKGFHQLMLAADGDAIAFSRAWASLELEDSADVGICGQ